MGAERRAAAIGRAGDTSAPGAASAGPLLPPGGRAARTAPSGAGQRHIALGDPSGALRPAPGHPARERALGASAEEARNDDQRDGGPLP